MDAFAKSDDERDFYLDRMEGFIVYVDLDKSEHELDALMTELKKNPDRFHLIPKLTFYETKKFMEGFVNEKVYDIDTKEKLLDVIQSKEARENFIEFIYDNLTELEKWQQYYHERSRIRIIEWLRLLDIHFVFEEDMELTPHIIEKLKEHLFDERVSKELQIARDVLDTKSKTYYSNEALNPRPKRGRPPKQVAKVEVELQLTSDIYAYVPNAMRPFLYLPDFSAGATTFSTKFDTEAQLIASLKGSSRAKVDTKLEVLSQRLESLRHLSSRLRSEVTEPSEQTILKAFEVEEEGEERSGSKVLEIAKGFLPKHFRQKPKTKEEIQEMIVQKRQRTKKSVTQIKHKKESS